MKKIVINDVDKKSKEELVDEIANAVIKEIKDDKPYKRHGYAKITASVEEDTWEVKSKIDTNDTDVVLTLLSNLIFKILIEEDYDIDKFVRVFREIAKDWKELQMD